MGLIQYFKNKVRNAEIEKLEGEVQKLQHLIRDDILSLTERSASYKGNEYTTYNQAVAEIDRKYRGVADWGVLQTGNIIDLRAAFIIGEGIKVKGEEGAENEIAWVEKFLEYNDLDKEIAQEFAKEAEIEGKIALKLEYDEFDEDQVKDEGYPGMVSVRFVSWLDKKYTVTANEGDYLKYEKLEWKATSKRKAGKLPADKFVYKKFGGRASNPNEAAPKIMKCLTQVEALDKALRDWREINRIFAGPILYVEIDINHPKAMEFVKKANEAFDERNFKIKKMLAGVGKLQFVKFDVGGIESIEQEIITNAKMVSGTTACPVHFLGLVDLMSNRATAENLMELITAGTTKERETWTGTYEEVIRKAMIIFNEATGKNQMSKEKQLDPDKISIDIPIITKEHYNRIEKIFVPLFLANKLSDEAFYEMVPGFDFEKEKKRKEEREASELEQTKHELEDLKSKDLDSQIFGPKKPEGDQDAAA